MKRSESKYASQKITVLQRRYRVRVLADWGFENPKGIGAWNQGSWSMAELGMLEYALALLADVMGGPKKFIRNLGGLSVRKSEMGSHGGEALVHLISLSSKGSFSAWTVIHELAHAWDANRDWKCSLALERYTGGYTNKFFSFVRKRFGNADCGMRSDEDKPGRRGRLPGCNAAGYFYGDQPSGSNWNLNRREDFAESVAMYIGWGRDNELSRWAEARLERYRLKNGARHKSFGVDNWADYAKYFYPPDGDYARTRRWKFVDELLRGRLGLDAP